MRNDVDDKVVSDVESRYLKSMIKTVQRSFDSMSSASANSSFKCEECDFTINTKDGLKTHVERDHKVTCENCNENYAGNRKLLNHMCRVHIKNPSQCELYMKNWFINNECIRVFSEKKKKGNCNHSQ